MTEEPFLQLADAWPEAVLLVMADGTVLGVNRYAQDQFGLPQGELRGKRMDEVAESPGDIAAYLRACSRSRQRLPGSLIFRLPGREGIACQVQGSVLRPRSGDVPALLLLRLVPKETAAEQFLALNEKIEELSKEVRERKQAQARLEVALQERDVLLREVHHRVKNNMQILAALLGLHALEVEDPKALQVLEEARNRIQAMAKVHQGLYSKESLERLDLAPFLEEFVPELMQSYRAPGQHVSLRLDLDHVSLGLEAAVACGLLAHELVSNALKHAFPNGRPGNIEVALKRTGQDGGVMLRVGDDGTGMPPDFDPSAAESFGIQLVNSLVRQLGGSLSVDVEKGTSFTITFRG